MDEQLTETDIKVIKAIKKSDLDELMNHSVVTSAPDKFRKNIKLLRNIVYCRTNLKDRVSMFDDLVKWHDSYRPEEIKESEIANSLQTGSFFINGKDKMGRPIIVIFGVLHDPETRDLQETVRAIVYWVERGIQLMDPGVDQFVLIYDRTNVASKHFDIAIVKEWGQIQNYYPLRLGRAIILHPNWLFNMSLKICSVFLSEEALSKIYLCDEKKWKSELIAIVDQDNLLECHGGRMKSPYEHIAAIERGQSPSGRHIMKSDPQEEETSEEHLESWNSSLANDDSKEAELMRKAVSDLQKAEKKKKKNLLPSPHLPSVRTPFHHSDKK